MKGGRSTAEGLVHISHASARAACNLTPWYTYNIAIILPVDTTTYPYSESCFTGWRGR